MAVTQERYEIQVAMRLKRDGWVHDMYHISISDCKQRAEWCRETFGPMYDDMIMAGKWYGAELPFQSGIRPEYWNMAQQIKQHFGVEE